MSFVLLYLYVPDEGSLLPKYRDCTTSNDFELYVYIYIDVIVIFVVFLLFLWVGHIHILINPYFVGRYTLITFLTYTDFCAFYLSAYITIFFHNFFIAVMDFLPYLLESQTLLTLSAGT